MNDLDHTPNPNGECLGDDRDWCPTCQQCVIYDGENCSQCGREWGSE